MEKKYIIRIFILLFKNFKNYYNNEYYLLEKESPTILILNFKNNTDIANCLSRYLKIVKLEDNELSNISSTVKVKVVNDFSHKKYYNNLRLLLSSSNNNNKYNFQKNDRYKDILKNYNTSNNTKYNIIQNMYFLNSSKKSLDVSSRKFNNNNIKNNNNNNIIEKRNIIENLFFLDDKNKGIKTLDNNNNNIKENENIITENNNNFDSIKINDIKKDIEDNNIIENKKYIDNKNNINNEINNSKNSFENNNKVNKNKNYINNKINNDIDNSKNSFENNNKVNKNKNWLIQSKPIKFKKYTVDYIKQTNEDESNDKDIMEYSSKIL